MDEGIATRLLIKERKAFKQITARIEEADPNVEEIMRSLAKEDTY